MARAKNRGYQQSFSPSYTIRRWRLGMTDILERTLTVKIFNGSWRMS